jgi:hypothetical protein
MKGTKKYARIVAGVLLCLLAVLLLTGQQCSESSVLSFQPGVATMAPGETVTMNVYLQRAGSHYPAGIQFSLTYDPAVVTVESVGEGSLFAGSCSTTFFRGGTIDNEGGMVTGGVCVVTEPGCSVSSSGTVFTITFTAGTEPGYSILQLSGVKLGNVAGNLLSCSGSTGKVEVTAP